MKHMHIPVVVWWEGLRIEMGELQEEGVLFCFVFCFFQILSTPT